MASREQRRRGKKLAEEKFKLTEKKKSSNPVMWVVSVIILLVIIVTFVGAPLTGGASSGNNLVFGSYDGDEIIYSQGSYFYDQVNTIADEYRDSMTDDNAFFIQYQVWHSAFNKALVRKAAINECKNGGFLVSDNAVDEAIVLYGPYMENGEFSDNLYQQSSNIEKTSVRKSFIENLYYSRFLTDLTDVNLNNNEIEFFKNIGKIEKKFSYVLFPFTEFPDENVKEYARENVNLFRSMKLSSITIDSSKRDAEEILSQLNNSPDMFSELAKTQSADPYAEKGGEIGERFYYDMNTLITDEEFLNNLFSMKDGEISPILENDESWVIYKCDSAAEKIDMSISSSVKKVKGYMESYAKGTIEDFFTKQAEEFSKIALSSGFSEAASTNDLTIYETNSFPLVYGNPSFNYYGQPIPIFNKIDPSDPDKSISSLSTNEYALKQMAKLEKNQVSEPIVFTESIAVFQLLEVSEKNEEDLENIGIYIDFAAKDWTNTQFETIALESDKIEDNFSTVFSKIFAQ